MKIPPPQKPKLLAMITFEIIGLDSDLIDIPPPTPASLSMIIRSVIVGLEEFVIEIPPPSPVNGDGCIEDSLARPFFNVNPFNTAEVSTPPFISTTLSA